jgi:hypothetical protein
LEKTRFFQKSTPLRGPLPLRAKGGPGLFQSQTALNSMADIPQRFRVVRQGTNPELSLTQHFVKKNFDCVEIFFFGYYPPPIWRGYFAMDIISFILLI